MRFFGRAMRWAARGGMRRRLCRCPSFQALLKCVHQADDIVRPLLGLGGLDRLAGGLALDRIFRAFSYSSLNFDGSKCAALESWIWLPSSMMSFDHFRFLMSSKYSCSSRTS